MSAVPVVLTIHDVSYERHPEWYPYRRDRLRRAFYRRSARAAAHILTDSEFSRGEIAAAYGIAPDRITVAPLGVAASSTQGDAVAASLPAGNRRAVSAARRRSARAAQSVGGGPRCSRRAGDSGRSRASLVLRRRRSRHWRSTALPPRPTVVLPDAVVRLGAVAESTLRSLYRGAAALVYPSLYEGFGLPLLEAMASGTPVIASRAASIPEVVGEAGMLLDPDDSEAWADAIVHVITDPG